MKLHHSLTSVVIQDAVDRRFATVDNPGFCIGCGHEHDPVEPDARRYKCDKCGRNQVYGAEEILIAMELG